MASIANGGKMVTTTQSADGLIRLYAPSIEAAAVFGSWAPGVEASRGRREDGTWQASLRVADGRYTYRLSVRSRSWFREGDWAEIVDPTARELERREDGEWGV